MTKGWLIGNRYLCSFVCVEEFGVRLPTIDLYPLGMCRQIDVASRSRAAAGRPTSWCPMCLDFILLPRWWMASQRGDSRYECGCQRWYINTEKIKEVHQ